MRPSSLKTRLFASYAAVAVVGAATLLAAIRLLVPRLYDDRVGRFGRRSGTGEPEGVASQHDAVVSAVNVALVLAFVASLVTAAVVAVVMARRVLRPLDDLRAATGRLAAGRYDEPVALPNERELAALAADVNQLATALAETEQRRAGLIGDIAHEMRTPLTTITGYVEGFDDGLFTKDEMVATTSDEIARLRRLAGDLAAVSRAEEGQLLLDLHPEELSDIVQTVTNRLRPQFDAKSVTLSIDTPGPIDVEADRQRLTQAVSNLLGNALAYTPAGGAVQVSIVVENALARVTITDTGRGLTTSDTDRVFERFYRAEPRAHTAGTGIGLTIARAVARAHHGDLTAVSPGVGLGATFVLSLPLRRLPPRVAAAAYRDD
jgi:histidine kinase